MIALVAEHVPGGAYLATYTPLLLGCALALVMYEARTFRVVRWLAHPVVTLTSTLLAIAVTAFMEGAHGHAHTLLALLVTLALPGLLVGHSWLRAPLEATPLRFIGTRSDALYLVHPLIVTVVGSVLPPGRQVGRMSWSISL